MIVLLTFILSIFTYMKVSETEKNEGRITMITVIPNMPQH
jgi:hypothetical protein